MSGTPNAGDEPVRVLFVCTANSARSQIAEALLTAKGKGRVIAGSTGSQPADRVNPFAVRVLGEMGIDWSGKVPKGFDAVLQEHWDIVITVCDNARESCPLFPGQPVSAHWSLRDPASVTGSEDAKLGAFRETLRDLDGLIDQLLRVPLHDSKEKVATQLQAIGDEYASRYSG